MVVKLAMRPKDHDPDSFATVMGVLMSSGSSIYDRGLAAWAVGRLLQLQSKHDKYYLKKQILDQSGTIMDALVDIIGASKELSKMAAAAAAASGARGSSSSTVTSAASLTISPKRAKKKKLKSSSPSSTSSISPPPAPLFSGVSILDQSSMAGDHQPSVNDCSKISKNCSLMIVMLSNFVSEGEDGDPYTFQPPPTPLHRMAATPEVIVNADDEFDSKKMRTMRKNRRKHRHTLTNKDAANAETKGNNDQQEDENDDQNGGDLDRFIAASNREAEEAASDASESPKGKGERKYFRKTRLEKPDLLLSEYMSAPQVLPSDLGQDPHPRKTMNPNAIAGELTMADGSKMITLSRREGGPQPRTSVLFDDQPAWDVPVAAAESHDFLAKDSKLGYQVPRLYLGQDRPHTSNHVPTMPSPRGSPTNKALRPKTSEDIRQEYHSIEAKYMLDEIRKMTPSETGWYSLPPDEEWQAKAFPDGQPPVWTPSKGVNPSQLPKAWSTMNFNSTTKKMTPKSSRRIKTELIGDGEDQFDEELLEIKNESPTRRKEKTLLRQRLAGDSQTYESRQIQRARDKMSASTNFAFFPPNVSSPPLTAAAAEPKWEDEDEEDEVDVGVRFSPQSRGVSRARTSSPFKPRPVSPYQIDDILASTPQYLPGTMVELDDYRRLQLTTAESKMANKRANLASREAKEEYRRRRLNAIVSADDKDLPPEELSKLARQDHRSIISILTNQRNTLDTHALSLKNKIDANMKVQNKALPLRFLFTVEGGAEICRARLRDCFGLWIHGFESAQKTVAMAMWKMLVDAQVRKEKHAIYRAQAGRRKLKVIIKEIDLRLYKRTLDRWSKTVSYLIYVERDRAATKIQAQIYRYRAALKFIWLHDSKPIGGPLSDIYLEPIRKNVKFIIYPRVRTEKRQFWAGALAIQTRYRMVGVRNHFVLMKASSVMIQSIWRMWVERKEYMRLRRHAILIESMARMVVKKWKFRRLLKAARVAQRIFRGYRAKLRFFILLKKYRVEIERRLSMPPRIQRAWRIKVAKRRVQALRDDKNELYDAAVRLQCFWYRHQGEFPRFVLLGVLRETDKLEQEFEKQIKRYGKEALARKIQRFYRAHLRMRHEKGAVRIQCMARNAAGTNLVARLRLEKWANRKLRCWARGMMKKRNKASRKIAFAFWRGKRGRFLEHLKVMNDRMEKEEQRVKRKMLNYHASILQAVVHGVWTRRIIKRTVETMKIQRVARGFLGRRKALARLRSIQSAVATSFISRMAHEAEIKEVYRIKKVKKQSATDIGRCWRGHAVRDRLWREKEERRIRNEAATVLQRKYRKMLQVKRARAKILHMQRALTNPFREHASICELVKECISRTDLKYNPHKVICGASLQTLCYRLHILDDVYPLLEKAHIHTTHELLQMTDAELEKIGIKEEIHGKRTTGIKNADHLRSVLVALGRDPHGELSDFERKCHDDYNLCPAGGQQKSQAVRKVFEEIYGDRFAARAANFAVGAVLEKSLSALKLARFFSLHDTPGLAKEHVADLLKHDIKHHEVEFDDSRVEEALDIMLYATETTKLLVKGHPGLYYKVIQSLDLVEGDILRKKQELKNHPSALQIRNHHKRERLGVERLYLLLNDLRELDEAARVFQRAARGFNAGRIMKLAREKKFVDSVKEDYLFQRNNNHVLDIWKEDRRKEKEEYDRKYQEWLKEEERKRIDFALKDILREGWREEWRENEQENDAGEGYTMYVKEEKKKISRREREERALPLDQTHVTEILEKIDKPIYAYEDWMATLVMQRLGRTYMARTMVKRIKRERLRKEKEEQEKKKWEELQKQRKQLVTLKFNLDVVKVEDDIWEGFDPSCIRLAEDTWDNAVEEESEEESDEESHADASTTAGSSIAISKKKAENAHHHKPKYFYDDPNEETKDAFLVEMESLVDTETAIEIGSVVQAKFNNGEIYYGGVVFQVNPTTFISTQGTKTYPKDTFGILYDDGDWEPDVHKSDIRVVKLKEGMKVEARFGGHEAYFAGTVTGTNTRDGKILSYKVTYDDGSEEKAVRRSRIKVGEDIIKETDAKHDKLYREHKALVKRKKETREKQMAKWFDRMDTIDSLLEEYEELSEVSIYDRDKDDQIKHVTEIFIEDWTPQDYVKNTKGPDFGFRGESGCADLTKTKLKIAKFKELGRKLFDVVRPQVRCISSLKYTKMPLPYGWREFRHFGNIAGYQNDITGERRGIADVPTFTFQEDLACRRLQSQWRALEGKREFQKKLTNQSILSVLNLSVEEAKKKCWLGYNQEGMTLEMWLTRLGLGQTVHECMERYAKDVRKRGGGRRTSGADGHGHSRKMSRFGATDDIRRLSRAMVAIGEDGDEVSEVGSVMSGARKPSVMGGSRGRQSIIGGSRGRQSIVGGSRGRQSVIGSRGRQGSVMSPSQGRRTSSASPEGGRRTSSAGGGRRRSNSQGSDGGSRKGSRPGTVDDHHVAEADGVDTSILTLKIFLRRCESDRWLESMGFTKESDRRAIKDMKHGSLEARQKFKFLNYYKNASDPRSIRHCVEDSEDLITTLVTKRYRNNPKRVHAIVHELCSSNYPITGAQVERFFKKYDGKPAMAQENVRKELVDVKTTSGRAEEKECYEILKSGISRVGVLLNNLGVAELTTTLNEAIGAAEKVIEDGKVEEKRREEEKKRLEEEEKAEKEGEEKEKAEKERRVSKMPGAKLPGAGNRRSSEAERRASSAAAGLFGGEGAGGLLGQNNKHHVVHPSGHEAKAGLILRRDAIQLVIDWWNSTLLLQKRFRGFKQRKAYRAMQAERAKAATKLQGGVRTFIFVKKLTKYLQSQYSSKIEQLWSDEESAFYWFDKKSQTSVWEEPQQPYRPMIRDKFTQQLMQAWPILDNAVVEDPEAPPGVCMICKEQEATRMCNHCEQKNSKIKWGDGYLHTCFVCFSTFHNETAELRKHTFTVTKKAVARSLTCCMCGGLASRRCRGMVIADDVKDKLTTVVVEALDQGGGGKAKERGVGVLDQIEEEDFVNVVKENLGLGHLFSDERIKAMYVECKGKFKDKRSTAEIWKRFQEHLDAIKDECDENYCANCWESTHSRGKRSKHQWVGFMEGCRVCVECEILPADKFCEVCEDDYCRDCAKDTHRHGKKHRHPFVNVTEPLEPQQVHCSNCEFRVATEQCKFCKKMMCDSCNKFEHPDVCAVRLKLLGGNKADSHAITCAVCEKPPDVMCEQCGDVYCSVKWMGNPGCFRKTHMKGNRKEHKCIPYTFLEDRKKHEEEEVEKARRAHEARVEKMRVEKEKREALERNLIEKAEARKAKLSLDAQKEFETRHKGRIQAAAAKKWSKYLPALFGGGEKKSREDMIMNMPTVDKMNEQMRLAKEKYDKEVLEREQSGGTLQVNPHAPP
ncbi:hypothetical protein TrRE_jg4376, partial [Triparma retinervis]